MFHDDFDEGAFLAAWAAADADAVAVLCEALPGVDSPSLPPLPELQRAVARIRAGVRQGARPYDYFRAAAAWQRTPPPPDDMECFLEALVSTIVPTPDPGEPAEDQAAVAALEHADWVGAVVGLVRAGVGAPAAPDDLIRYIDECPEIEGERDPDDEVLEHAFEVLLPLWEAIGVVDDRHRVTGLGVWALPRLLLGAWMPELPRSGG